MTALLSHHDFESLRYAGESLRMALRDLRAKMLRRLFSVFLMDASLLESVATIRVLVLRTPQDTEIDPDDELDRCLRDFQHGMRESISQAQDVIAGLQGVRNIMPRVMAYAVVGQLARLHARAGELRTLIREHDADASPRGPSFDNADALIRHLRQS